MTAKMKDDHMVDDSGPAFYVTDAIDALAEIDAALLKAGAAP